MAAPLMLSLAPAKSARRLETLLFLHALECYKEHLRAHLLSPLTLSAWVETAQQRGVFAQA